MHKRMTPEERLRTVSEQLGQAGLAHPARIFLDLPTPMLYEEIVRRNEGRLAFGGSVVVETGVYTGRSAQDKFFVEEPESRERVDWSPFNRPVSEAAYDGIRRRVSAFLQGRDWFVQECLVGADPTFQRRVRVVTTQAWHALFARNLFIHHHHRRFSESVQGPDFTLIVAPDFKAVPELDATRSEAFILVHLGKCEILIGGTSYGGEIKKAIFTMMNDWLPGQGVLPMHCSANVGSREDVAIFFGLSGTGKTTLSTDPKRKMVGDDEHGWSGQGIFNIEGGCYAKAIRLSEEAEPEIFACTRKFGTILENVILDPLARRLDLNSDQLTENTRAAYPLSSLTNIQPSGMAGHPSHVLFLAADAFGILPPVARLSPEQAMYHFLSGYTSKLAGTERGVTEPRITFSFCFGAPFMVHSPVSYANMLGKRLAETRARAWLVNTGWTGGGYGVGTRMPIAVTRRIIDRILSGALNDVPCRVDPVFGLHVPETLEGVPEGMLDPRKGWPDPGAFDDKARFLAGQFVENFRQFEGGVGEAARKAGPVWE